MEPVEITAGRLHLRPWQAADEDAVFEICQDPEIQRWTRVPVPYTRAAARAFVTHTSPQGWQAGTAASFAVIDVTSGSLLASIVLFDIREGSAEVGYWCAPAARGQGVTTDAVHALCRWGFASLGLARIEWAAGVGNWESFAVAQKCGFTFEGRARSGLVQRGERSDGWRAALLATDEVTDRRALPAPPTLTDGVVTLRPWSLADAPDVARACDDPETARWLAAMPRAYTLADAESWLTTTVPQGWASGSAVALAATAAAGGEVLGQVGLYLKDRAHGRAGVGYWTAPWARGRGAASRGTALLSRWAIDALGLNRLELLADVDNLSSQRAAEKAGFTREAIARGARVDRDGSQRDFVQYSLLSSDVLPLGGRTP